MCIAYARSYPQTRLMNLSTVTTRLQGLGLTLPLPPPPGGEYLPYQISGKFLFLAGTISSMANGEEVLGQVGGECSFEDGQKAAEFAALNLIASIRAATDDFATFGRLLTLNGYVNAVADYRHSPKVINSASELLIAVFGDAGRHARAAVSVAGLPKGATVELQAMVELV